MTSTDLLLDAFGRIRDGVHDVVRGLSLPQLTHRLDAEANTIAWLVWHLTRVQDDHVAGAAGTEQAWTADGWVSTFGLPFRVGSIGYGQSSDDVAQVRAGADLLVAYHDAVHENTRRYVEGRSEPDLARVVDENWDPPVTLAVRLVSVVQDDLMHLGQAAFVRGVVLRAGSG